MDRDDLRFNILRNALYHTSRRMAFERWNRWFNFVVVALGAAGVADLVDLVPFDHIDKLIGGSVAAVGAAQLAFDFGGRARDHQSLQREYYHLLADLEAAPNTEDENNRICATMAKVFGDEPPVLQAVDAKAYNDACGSLERPDDQLLYIPWRQRLLGQFLAFDGYRYKKLGELKPSLFKRIWNWLTHGRTSKALAGE